MAFARGTGEPPGVGFVGQAFVDALRAQAGGRTVGVHGVNYPASSNFADSLEFRRNVVDGIRDEADHVQGVLAVCPNTRMLLAGYSQGAAATAFVTSGVVPADVPADYLPAPLPSEIADRVAAVVLFGKPSGGSLVKYGVPAADIGPSYAGKSLELCALGDMVCSGDPAAAEQRPRFVHRERHGRRGSGVRHQSSLAATRSDAASRDARSRWCAPRTESAPRLRRPPPDRSSAPRCFRSGRSGRSR